MARQIKIYSDLRFDTPHDAIPSAPTFKTSAGVDFRKHHQYFSQSAAADALEFAGRMDKRVKVVNRIIAPGKYKSKLKLSAANAIALHQLFLRLFPIWRNLQTLIAV